MTLSAIPMHVYITELSFPKETGQEEEGDNEQHAAGDDSDGEFYGQELCRARHELRRSLLLHGHTQP